MSIPDVLGNREKWHIECGDARDVLREMADESVHCVVTSPPYWGLRDYGLAPTIWGGDAECQHEWGNELPSVSFSPQQDASGGVGGGRLHGTRGQQGWTAGTGSGKASRGQFCQVCGAWRGVLGLEPSPQLYVQHIVEVFQEVKRVLRDDGTLWVVIGDSYASIGRSGRKESPGVGAKQAMAPVNRDIVWKAGGDSNFSWQLPGKIKPKDLVGIPWMVAFALRDDGWWLRSDIIWAKPSCMPESVTDRPTQSYEHVFLLAKSKRYFYDNEAIKEQSTTNDSRRPYTSNGAWQVDGRPIEQRHSGERRNGDEFSTRNKRNVWTVATSPYLGAHFATFPPALIEPMILAGTSAKGCCAECGAPWERVIDHHTSIPQRIGGDNNWIKIEHQRTDQQERAGGFYDAQSTTLGWRPTCSCDAGDPIPAIVLDPFVGAGTTVMVALRHGRRAIGIDAKPEYCEMARNRIIEDNPMFNTVGKD
ncbi:MAG TPA: site-specific DNA-methyltransferase [Sedimentisphaerales bacterium]|nr:site-specific DNA-methyltransferase [Sedimentisphaerales bacterium]